MQTLYLGTHRKHLKANRFTRNELSHTLPLGLVKPVRGYLSDKHRGSAFLLQKLDFPLAEGNS